MLHPPPTAVISKRKPRSLEALLIVIVGKSMQIDERWKSLIACAMRMEARNGREKPPVTTA